MITSIGKNGEMGRKNKLIWQISQDLKRFRSLTRGHPVIMGRKTAKDHLVAHYTKGPLPGRVNIVITKDKNFKLEGFVVVHSVEEAIEEAKKAPGFDEAFVIGGSEIFSLVMPYADRLYLTKINAEAKDADTFFPDYSIFKKIVHEEDGEENGIKYKFIDLEK